MRNSREYIDKLVNNYKTSRGEAKKAHLKDLLDAFEGYIMKYVNFLRYGSVSSTDNDIKQLVYMLKGPEPTNVIGNIQHLLYSYTKDDIVNQLQMLFIECVNNYEKQKEGPSFIGYLYSYYKFMIRDWFRDISKNAINHYSIAPYVEDCADLPNSKKGLWSELVEQQYNEYKNDLSDPTRTNICFLNIKGLNNLETYILYLYYELGMSEEQIAEIINTSRPSISRIKNIIKEKLLKTKNPILDK